MAHLKNLHWPAPDEPWVSESEEAEIYEAVIKKGKRFKSIGEKYGLKSGSVAEIYREQCFIREQPKLAREMLKAEFEGGTRSLRSAAWLWQKGYAVTKRKK